MSTLNFQQFLTGFGQAHRVGIHVIVLDGAGIHWAKELQILANVVLIKLPPHCPELNPIKWFWRELKRPLRWQNWLSPQAMKDTVWQTFHNWDNEMIQALASLPYILQKILAM